MLYVIVTNILAVVVVLGIMILIHELGHFLAAKYFGIGVQTFSFGFGPRLFGFESGGTDYRVSALPLGGYVKMAGENPGEPLSGSAGRVHVQTALAAVHRRRDGAGHEHPVGHRFADGTVHVPLPETGLRGGTGSHWLGRERFLSRHSRPRDRGPHHSHRWPRKSQLGRPGIAGGLESRSSRFEVTVERNGQLLTRTVTPQAEGRARLGSVGWYPSMPAKLQGVQAGLPAEKAGLKAGDEIISIDGSPVHFWPRISEIASDQTGKRTGD